MEQFQLNKEYIVTYTEEESNLLDRACNRTGGTVDELVTTAGQLYFDEDCYIYHDEHGTQLPLTPELYLKCSALAYANAILAITTH